MLMSIDLPKLNEAVQTDPRGLIAECDAAYDRRVYNAAVKIKENIWRSPIILLAGPSSSAKTTTAGRLRHMLRGMGVGCHMVSLDDYYRTRSDGNYPLTADGEPDLESPLALDIPLLNEHLFHLGRGEEVQIPHFSFPLQRRTEETVPLRIAPGDCVIFEGIHGLNDLFADHKDAFRIYVSDDSHITENGKRVFDKNWTRLLRRCVRDLNYRGFPIEETLALWDNVRLGESLYITPYIDRADVTMDTSLGYEVPVLAAFAAPYFAEMKVTVPQAELIRKILHRLEKFAPIDPALVPDSSLLREEFIK
ncbi:MAG: nucleoside kinase [Oscillospiraceae bacterium]|nr:nucleoside kinase [Oscillospiraceae bacterium]